MLYRIWVELFHQITLIAGIGNLLAGIVVWLMCRYLTGPIPRPPPSRLSPLVSVEDAAVADHAAARLASSAKSSATMAKPRRDLLGDGVLEQQDTASVILAFCGPRGLCRLRATASRWRGPLCKGPLAAVLWRNLFLNRPRFAQVAAENAPETAGTSTGTRTSNSAPLPPPPDRRSWYTSYRDAHLIELFRLDNARWIGGQRGKRLAALARSLRAGSAAQVRDALGPLFNERWADQCDGRRIPPVVRADQATLPTRYVPTTTAAYLRHTLMESCRERLQAVNGSTDRRGNTLLVAAAQSGDLKMAKFLVKKGAYVNHRNADGNTAMHFAFHFGYADLAAWLIESGADDTLLNRKGLSPYDGLHYEGEEEEIGSDDDEDEL